MRLGPLAHRLQRFDQVPSGVSEYSTMGGPKFYADYLIDLSQHYRKGGADTVTTAVKDVTGLKPVTFEQFVKDNAAAF